MENKKEKRKGKIKIFTFGTTKFKNNVIFFCYTGVTFIHFQYNVKLKTKN